MASHVGLFFFALAAWMIYSQLQKYSLTDILHSITRIPFKHVVWACFACLGGYLVLSCYDFLALRYIGKKLAWWKWMLAGMLGFAISNNAGSAAISGGAIRYRLYTRWRVRAGEIVKMLTFSGVTYYLGTSIVLVAGYLLLHREGIAAAGPMHVFCIVGSAFIGAYSSICAFFHGKTFKIGEIVFKIPSVKTELAQMVVGTLDSVLAGLVLYCLSFHFVKLPIIQFISIFAVAQSVGIFAQVPGGIGVFESIVLFSMPEGVDRAALFGSLLAFRIIYFVIPLVGIGSMFFIYEHYLRNTMKKWRMFSHVHMPHIKRNQKRP